MLIDLAPKTIIDKASDLDLCFTYVSGPVSEFYTGHGWESGKGQPLPSPDFKATRMPKGTDVEALTSEGHAFVATLVAS